MLQADLDPQRIGLLARGWVAVEHDTRLAKQRLLFECPGNHAHVQGLQHRSSLLREHMLRLIRRRTARKLCCDFLAQCHALADCHALRLPDGKLHRAQPAFLCRPAQRCGKKDWPWSRSPICVSRSRTAWQQLEN